VSEQRTICEYEGRHDLETAQARLFAAASLKTAVKKYLDDCEGCLRNRCSKYWDMRKALERWLNPPFGERKKR
jgi:hypothetical protein